MTILLFILLLIVSFVVLLYFLRPTATETAVQQHLETIEENRCRRRRRHHHPQAAGPERDSLAGRVPAADTGIRGTGAAHSAGGRTWQVSSLFLVSLVVTVSVALLASLAIPSIMLSLLLGIGAGSLPYRVSGDGAGAPVQEMRCPGA